MICLSVSPRSAFAWYNRGMKRTITYTYSRALKTYQIGDGDGLGPLKPGDELYTQDGTKFGEVMKFGRGKTGFIEIAKPGCVVQFPTDAEPHRV